MLPWTPRFDYGTGPTSLSLTWPMRHFRPIDMSVGGTAKSATGVPASYQIRREQHMEITIRFTEAEWPSVRTMLAYGQAHPNTLTFYPDQTDIGTSYTVYLESPVMGEALRPERGDDDPSVYSLPLTLRESSGAVFSDIWYS